MKRMIMCAQANEMDLVDFLRSIGHKPSKIRNNDYWYLSPLRQEKTPSFKVDRKLNLWYDHGDGRGGNLVDFGVLFFGCSVGDFLHKLEENTAQNFSFQPPFSPPQHTQETNEIKLKIIGVNPVLQPRFCHYLCQRKVDVAIAKLYVNEVAFALNGKPFTALGFQNNSGGFELRNEHFKGSSSPKDVTVIAHQSSENIAVFEGFFSFLSYLSLKQKSEMNIVLSLPEGQPSFLVLNSLSFFEKSRSLMERHNSVHLYLDRDAAGLEATAQALHWSQKYKDKSALYKGHKDLNDFLTQNQTTEQRQSLRRGRHL